MAEGRFMQRASILPAPQVQPNTRGACKIPVSVGGEEPPPPPQPARLFSISSAATGATNQYNVAKEKLRSRDVASVASVGSTA